MVARGSGWRGYLKSTDEKVVILPLFIVASRRIARRLRDLSREQLNANAAMNAGIQETLNIGGVLLVKLFGRVQEEIDRFDRRVSGLRDLNVDRAAAGASFFVMIGLVERTRTCCHAAACMLISTRRSFAAT